MASHRKFYDVYAVKHNLRVGPRIDRKKAEKVLGVEAQTIKEAEDKGRRFCSLMNVHMTHLKELGYATENKR